jgi:serpin B
VLVLANAVHFRGTWRTRFDVQRTETGMFRVSPARSVPTPMMSLTADLQYAESELLQAVRLPFDGELEMVILVPREPGGLPEVEADLSAEGLEAILAGTSTTRVALGLPKFTAGSRFELSTLLASMGMPLAFTPRADFSGINGRSGDLFISLVVHQAFVTVDERGAEAAAATGVVLGRGGPHLQTVRADRPFLYLIRHAETGSVVFLGRLVDPTGPGA